MEHLKELISKYPLLLVGAILVLIGAIGWVKDMKKNQHVWLVVEVGTHKWPKADSIRTNQDGTWRRTIFEDGSGTVFSLSLYVADAEGHDKIQKWLDIGGLIGYHPFEVDIPGTRRLARIENLQK